MKTIRAAEARANFAELLRRVSKHKETILIERRGKPAVAVVPAEDVAPDGDQEIAGSLSRDITQRMDAERALRKSEQRFRNFVDASSDWFWEMDDQCRFSYFSDRFTEVTGVPQEALLGKTREETGVPGVDPGSWNRHLGDLAARRSFRDFRHPRSRPDGRVVQLSINGMAVFDEAGNFKGYRGTGTDITERVQAEESLRESEARLRAIMDYAPMEIYLKDAEGRFVEINRHYEELWGVRNKEVCGKLPGDVHREEAFAKASRAHDLAVLKRGEVIEQEDEAHLDDGRHVLHMTKFPIRDADGQIAGLGAIAVDVTERKRVERELEESREILRGLTDNLPEFISLKDSQGRFLFVNKRFEEWVCVNRNDIVGKTVHDIYPAEQAAEFEALDRAVIASRSVMSNEVDLHYPDGNTRSVVRTRFPVISSNGEVLGLGTINIDASEHKRIEQALGQARDELELRVAERTTELHLANEALRKEEVKLREILENSPVGVAIVSHNVDGTRMTGDRLFVNSAIVQMFGAASRESFIKSNIADSWVDKEQLKAVEDVFKNRRELVDFEARRRRMDGTLWWVSMNTRSIRFNDQDCTMVWHFDITARKHAEEQLRQAQKMEAVGQLTGGVAHDFNNLLAVISGNTELISMKLGQDDPKIQAVLRATNRGAELTQRLLAFSRRQTLRPRAIEVNALVGGMIDLLGRSLGETIEIKTSFTAGLWRAKADPGQLENALLNLAINGRDAMPQGGTLVIEAGNENLDEEFAESFSDLEPGDYVTLTVSDSGGGMPPEVLAHAFEPFFTTKEVGEGSGLGLAMVYGFAKQSDGHVTISSEVGRGTTVTLYLPRSREAAARAGGAAVKEAPEAAGETIMVVEDDPDVRALAVTMLEDLGYLVLQASDGDAALLLLKETGPPDLLLSDVVLPHGLSGPAMAEKIKRANPATRVLFMSGYAEDTPGMRDWTGDRAQLLKKPFRKQDLARKVRGALDG